jgi:hypothetical protein
MYRLDGGLTDLRKGPSARGRHNNGAGAGARVRLNGPQQLGALRDGVVIGVKNLEFDSVLLRRRLSRSRLLKLIIVVLGDQGKQETQLIHVWLTRSGIDCPAKENNEVDEETMRIVSILCETVNGVQSAR